MRTLSVTAPTSTAASTRPAGAKSPTEVVSLSVLGLAGHIRFMDFEPIIKTTVSASNINGRIIKLKRPNQGIKVVDAMLEAWPREGGIVVTAVEPYDLHVLGALPLSVTDYGALTQEEFDSYFPSTGTTRES